VVSFVEGANLEIGTAPLVNGVATFISSTLSVGTHTIKASYGGDAHIAVSDSTAVTQQVNDEPITDLRAANSGPIASGRTAVLTATIGSGTHVAYQWNFGDGVMGSQSVVDHIYVKPGSYTAIVTATNSVSSLSAVTLVTVTSGNSIYLPLLLKM
jgi:PKD repeat protein